MQTLSDFYKFMRRREALSLANLKELTKQVSAEKILPLSDVPIEVSVPPEEHAEEQMVQTIDRSGVPGISLCPPVTSYE